MGTRPLHPRHGTHRPTVGTPARRPGSVRRTSTVDLLRPDGLTGPLTVDARARDLRTDPDGRSVAEETRVSAGIDYHGGWTLTALSAVPPDDRLGELVGATVAGGFRRRVQTVVPEHYDEATRLHLLLDDFPVATLVSGVAFGAAELGDGAPVRMAQTDRCSGWRTGGTIMVGITRDRIIPAVTGPAAPDLTALDPTGPAAPDLTALDLTAPAAPDPTGPAVPEPGRSAAVPARATAGGTEPRDGLAWHELPLLTPHALRRARRLDVWTADGVVRVDSLYRDSHVDADGRETVIHEYTVCGTVDPGDHRILTLVATPRVLPWVECPSAAASAERLTGQDVRALRPVVRRELTGISTCTHLNDQLRQLADVPSLVGFSAVR